jgi:pyridoxamine 5'-phosphate oxidase
VDDSLRDVRRDFTKGSLDEASLPVDPFDLLLNWKNHAAASNLPDYNAMSLATIDADGFPVSRIVLLREANSDGLCFYTNYHSSKGHDLALNPKASLLFFWPSLERQIRIRGITEKLSAGQSDSYFASRPRDSQIGAWSSPQSEVVASRGFLDENFARYAEKFRLDSSIPRPPHWGGYKLVPTIYEFWQGRPSRMHDRLRATLVSGVWRWERLAP